MTKWLGVKCPNCSVEIDFAIDAHCFGVWFYKDFPECSLIQMYCRHCKISANVYLGDEWDQDVPYLSSIGLGYIEADECPPKIKDEYRQTFGYEPLGTSHLSEILFFAHLLSNPHDEWWSEIET